MKATLYLRMKEISFCLNNRYLLNIINIILKASGDVKWSYDIKSIQVGEEKEPVLQLNVEGNILNQEKGFRMSETPPEKRSIFVSKDQLGTLIHGNFSCSKLKLC